MKEVVSITTIILIALMGVATYRIVVNCFETIKINDQQYNADYLGATNSIRDDIKGSLRHPSREGGINNEL